MKRLRLTAAAVTITFVAVGAAQQASRQRTATGEATRATTVDPQLQAVIDQHKALGPKPIDKLSPAEARKQPSVADAVKALLQKQGKSTAPEPVGKVEDRTIPGAAGQLQARVYTPKGNGPFPVLVYFHGGGWVIADLDTYDSSARALTNAAKAVVVSVHYRQAPEHKFPAAAEDAYAATQWVINHATSINGRPDQVAVAGESAGGNLATVTCLMARDKKGKMPVHQLLVYPVADHSMNTPSYQENAQGPILTKPMMSWFWNHYLPNAEAGNNPYASPLRAEVKGLPPATIITAGFDPLRDEGKLYADKLREAGIRVEYRNYPDMAHEFFGMGAVVDQAKQAVQQAGMTIFK